MDEETDAWESDRTLDAIGLACPLPVLKARKVLAGMKAGERLFLAASDPMAAIDIPHMCREDGHALERTLRFATAGGERLQFLIVVGDGPRREFFLGQDGTAADAPQDKTGGSLS